MWSASERSFVVGWIARVVVGEALGFAIATGVAVSLILVDAPPLTAVPLTVLGGAAEGAVLALAQWSAMRAGRPPVLAWVSATAGAAAVAWTLGLAPSTLRLDLADPAAWMLIGLGGVVLLLSIPVAQALVLRRPGAVRWVLVNAGAWAVGVLWTAAPSPFVDERSPVGLVIALYVAAGLMMALTVAAITAPVAIRLFSIASGGRHLPGRATVQPDAGLVPRRAAP